MYLKYHTCLYINGLYLDVLLVPLLPVNKKCFRWSELANETKIDGATGKQVPMFNSEENEIQTTVLGVLRKFVYFVEDPSVLDSYTPEEIHVFDNYVKAIPSLLQQVSKKGIL